MVPDSCHGHYRCDRGIAHLVLYSSENLAFGGPLRGVLISPPPKPVGVRSERRLALRRCSGAEGRLRGL